MKATEACAERLLGGQVDSIPTSTLINAHTGLPVVTLQDADFGPLLDAGFKFPEPFTAKADDGVTDIYGVIRTTIAGNLWFGFFQECQQ